ncbi:ATP-binding cassette sub-family A member 1-like isoform X6 [Cimex lectularius]|uniref:ABC transporter domain-containing protein n=1 Tax=Cimex lectularius TaxID=79782 RepID=A0A8I6SBW6_CIMLE|nr:ATP-binding cassette sub-family A member 1-like isoform X6 [Cimex lectularius]
MKNLLKLFFQPLTKRHSAPNGTLTKHFERVSKNSERFLYAIKKIAKDDDSVESRMLVLRNLLKNPDNLYETLKTDRVTINKEIVDMMLDADLKTDSNLVHLIFNNDTPKHCSFSGDELSSNIDEVLCNLSRAQLYRIKSNIDEMWNSFYAKPKVEKYIKFNLTSFASVDNWMALDEVIDSFEKITHNTRLTDRLYEQNVVNSNQDNQIENPDLLGNSTLFKIYSLVFKYLCGVKGGLQKISTGIIQDNPKQIENMQKMFFDNAFINYQYDNYTTPECNDIFKAIERNPLGRIIWRLYKPFLCGQILYYPDTPVVRRVMQRVNMTFVKIGDAINTLITLGTLDPNVETNRILSSIQNYFGSDKGQTLFDNESDSNVLEDDLERIAKLLEWTIDSFESKYNLENIGRNLSSFDSFLKCIERNKIRPYKDLKKAEKDGEDLILFDRLWALVEFISPGQNELSPLTTYKIRMSPDKVDNTEYITDRIDTPGGRVRPTYDLKYITHGFIYLQDLLDHSIIYEKTKYEKIPGAILHQLPYPCHIDDEFIGAVSRTFPLFMVLAWIYTTSMIVKSIVHEKELRLKETMRVMGLGNGIHWVGWTIDSLVPMLFTIAILSIILVYGRILTFSNPMVVFIFLLAYSLATVAQAFLISVFFGKANLAAACAGIIHFILYMPYALLARWFPLLSTSSKILMSLSSNVALGLGAAYFAQYEESAVGMHWSNINKSPMIGDQYNMLYIIYMLLLDAVLYMILTWYIETVRPGEYGIPKPWNFPFTLSYWTGVYPTKINTNAENLNDINETREDGPSSLISGVKIINLSKVYPNGKKAIDNISVAFYEGQITSFLGHNGAGKTTTISILTGLLPPTSGTALINGNNILTDMYRVRKNLGVCPQHNILFHRLTIKEHLWFYGMLRGGKKGNLLHHEIEQMLLDLNLADKSDAYSTDLSGGMQRKLSIAVAFIGGSKTVILDEPTSGVDPYSRRSIWELLIKYKKGRTLILTTHYMDEADLLGDRIAIIAQGRLVCVGSGVFLKSQLGKGYNLTVELALNTPTLVPKTDLNSESDVSISSETNIKNITDFIQHVIPNATIVDQIGQEVIYNLPSKNPSQLSRLCSMIDSEMDRLHIVSYGISDSSLEEIFLSVATDQEKNDSTTTGCCCFKKSLSVESADIGKYSHSTVQSKTEPKEIRVQVNGTNVKYSAVTVVKTHEEQVEKRQSKLWKQFIALHTKRFLHNKRNLKALFSELILPALLVCAAMLVLSILPSFRHRPELELTPWKYTQPLVFFLSADHSGNDMDLFVNEIDGSFGLGTSCLPADYNVTHTKCSVASGPIPSLFNLSRPRVTKCSCKTGAQVCPYRIDDSLPSIVLTSHDILRFVNLSDLSDWIINTWPKYKNQRVGGYTLNANLVTQSIDLKKIPFHNVPFQFKLLFEYLKNYLPEKSISTDNNIKVWFNNKNWIASVANLNAINNVILRALMNSSKSGEHGIRTINHPLKFNEKQKYAELLRNGIGIILMAIAVIFALSFVTASFCLYLIEERKSNSKHLQLVSGVNRLIYWFEAFVWDMCAFSLSVILCILVFLIFNEQAFIAPDRFPGVLSLMLLFGWSCIPLMYPASFFFDIPSSAFVSLSCVNMFIGVITTVTTTVLSFFDDEELKRIGKIIGQVFMIFPHFCLGDGLMKLSSSYITSALLLDLDIVYEQSVFSWGFLGKNLVCMFFLGILFMLITLAIEYRIHRLWKKSYKHNIKAQITGEEDDVAAERRRINNSSTSDDVLVIKDLVKIYPRKVTPSVNQICVGIKKGECFGLLGLNGAGKTTTFKMLTGDIDPSFGTATILGYDITKEIDKARSVLGYCPQFDALDPLLTPYEHLILYGRIRNLNSYILQARVDSLIKRMGLGFYRHRLAGSLSGGNKRKLSTAIALIGNPPLVFLDEPTTGMDPKAKRFLWKCIQEIVREGGCILLTSHSMEECQALCTRLTIMVNGQFKCLGSSQHLKNKYGGGYLIILRCHEDDMEKAKTFMVTNLPKSKMVEAHYNQIRYEVKDIQVTTLFSVMERAKEKKIITDYTLSQTTLEEVFLRFANEQVEILDNNHRQSPGFLKICKACYGKGKEEIG